MVYFDPLSYSFVDVLLRHASNNISHTVSSPDFTLCEGKGSGHFGPFAWFHWLLVPMPAPTQQLIVSLE